MHGKSGCFALQNLRFRNAKEHLSLFTEISLHKRGCSLLLLNFFICVLDRLPHREKKSLALKNFIKYSSFCDSLSVLRHTRS
ncbi:hypothetical protein CUB97_00860 [Prevotella intermedia]|uniref:Uncharacterized protein n=1 Tax=Prevotella intermedia TaxID=28131 RepID=A0A2M8M6X6_PREIN|nr:hypothetical protein CUB97_00860 [Prevotella intermedia]